MAGPPRLPCGRCRMPTLFYFLHSSKMTSGQLSRRGWTRVECLEPRYLLQALCPHGVPSGATSWGVHGVIAHWWALSVLGPWP